ncbi:helix-turn-helix domain-containing protein [Bhargavaea beijingensis]|uniref:helix-turn-helix domain-containing protein n=1 Tax=Bhargavaea beijingensis TaxID=426756 RepID=UPI002224E11C|nr:helix-turn-helix domain-containing protein [Bhargavaea beijingensis]MCW1929511.1 helix-turn-helix domain-containing protein [Bhargavaea beijingensis]
MAQEQYSATQIATIVDVKPSTLRKYASLLEEEGYIFEKDGHGRRLYSAMDLKAFEMLIAQSSNGAMSLNDSARNVYYWSKNPDVANGDTDIVTPQRRDDDATPSVPAQDLEPLMSILENQHFTIEHMGQQMEKQAEELSAMRSAMQQVFEQQGKQMDSLRQDMQQLLKQQEAAAALPEPEPEPERPRGVFARIFSRK